MSNTAIKNISFIDSGFIEAGSDICSKDFWTELYMKSYDFSIMENVANAYGEEAIDDMCKVAYNSSRAMLMMSWYLNADGDIDSEFIDSIITVRMNESAGNEFAVAFWNDIASIK